MPTSPDISVVLAPATEGVLYPTNECIQDGISCWLSPGTLQLFRPGETTAHQQIKYHVRTCAGALLSLELGTEESRTVRSMEPGQATLRLTKVPNRQLRSIELIYAGDTLDMNAVANLIGLGLKRSKSPLGHAFSLRFPSDDIQEYGKVLYQFRRLQAEALMESHYPTFHAAALEAEKAWYNEVLPFLIHATQSCLGGVSWPNPGQHRLDLLIHRRLSTPDAPYSTPVSFEEAFFGPVLTRRRDEIRAFLTLPE